MRNKVAKRLRREARALTVGANESQYRATNKQIKDMYSNSAIETKTLVLYETCTRAVYQKLKKEYKGERV